MGNNLPFTVTAIGSFVLINAILLTGLEVYPMNKQEFQHEVIFQTAMQLLRYMRDRKLITAYEFKNSEQRMLKKYKPFSGTLFT